MPPNGVSASRLIRLNCPFGHVSVIGLDLYYLKMLNWLLLERNIVSFNGFSYLRNWMTMMLTCKVKGKKYRWQLK